MYSYDSWILRRNVPSAKLPGHDMTCPGSWSVFIDFDRRLTRLEQEILRTRVLGSFMKVFATRGSWRGLRRRSALEHKLIPKP